MKRFLFMACTALIASAAFGKKPSETLDIKKTEKDFAKVPGLSAYRDVDGKQVEMISVFMYKYEVSNALYRFFLQDLKQRGATSKLEIAHVDTTGWRRPLTYNEPYVEYYFQHPAYKDYPVVNVTQAGALLFCEWLTEKYNQFEKRTYKGYKVTFRLPTAEQWTIAAKGGNENATYPWAGKYIRGGKFGDFMCNFTPIGDENITLNDQGKIELVSLDKRTNFYYGAEYTRPGCDAGNTIYEKQDITAPVKAYWPNAYGLYNMSGNVAEMVMEQGHTKGGCWRNTGYEVRIDAPDTFAGFTGSSPFIGFRMVMVVEKI